MPRTDRLERRIHAPAARVFAAFVDADDLLAWLPPEGMTGAFEHFDARAGGGYRLRLTYLDAADSPGKTTDDSDLVEVRFVEVVDGVRVVQAADFASDDPAFAGTMTMTWSVEGDGDACVVTILAEGVPDGISAADHEAGIGSSLDSLARLVELR